MSDPTARTLALLGLLQTHRHWSGEELARRLKVSERTVRRDIDRLRNLGYPVAATTGTFGGYRLEAGAHLPPLLVDDDEAVALTIGLRAAAGAAIEGIEETTVRVMAKVEQILPDRLRRRVEALNRNVDVLRRVPDTPVRPEHLAVLAQGCRDREEMRFGYTRRDGRSEPRLVRPHQMVSVGQRWYLVAWDVRRSDWRTYRIDRMADPRLAGVRFEPLVLPFESAADYVVAGLASAPQRYEATVTVDGPIAEVQNLTHWFKTDLQALNDARTTVTLGADSLDWLAAMIAILAVSYEVTVDESPDEVSDLLAATSRRLRR